MFGNYFFIVSLVAVSAVCYTAKMSEIELASEYKNDDPESKVSSVSVELACCERQ